MANFNQRRVMVVVVVIFLVVISFFAGRHYGHVDYIQPTGSHSGSQTTGIPPDSLQH